MCYSAPASFGVALLLAPIGIYSFRKAISLNRAYRLFALIPLVFALQQSLEGAVWLGLATANAQQIHSAALGFLFFSHLFWLIWIPLACVQLEQTGLRRTIYRLFLLLGVVHGVSLYLPLWVNAQWLSVTVIDHSISYQVTLIHDDYMPSLILSILYPLIIIGPLLLSSSQPARHFGLFILLSLAVTELFFSHALVSIWCAFAAILSLYIAGMMSRLSPVHSSPDVGMSTRS